MFYCLLSNRPNPFYLHFLSVFYLYFFLYVGNNLPIWEKIVLCLLEEAEVVPEEAEVVPVVVPEEAVVVPVVVPEEAAVLHLLSPTKLVLLVAETLVVVHQTEHHNLIPIFGLLGLMSIPHRHVCFHI
jgi:hypothetical protein